MHFKFRYASVFSICFLVIGCKSPKTVSYSTLLSGLTNLNEIARMDVPTTEMICSFDRTGANEDYNHFQGKTRDGQMILADLKGPGVVSRFWFTGVAPDARIQFYFDNEKAPRLDFCWNDLMAGLPPFDVSPISLDEQNCWHTFLPIPFKKRLLVTTEDRGYVYGGPTKLYYQLNWHRLAKNQSVKSFSLPLSAECAQQLKTIADLWKSMDFGPLPATDIGFDVPAGKDVNIWSGVGPQTIQTFTLQTDLSTISSAVQRDRLLRDVLLQIYWDGSTEPSVNVPLGDFFGSVWQRWRSESMFFGSSGDKFICRFPMPYAKSARIVLVNQSRNDFRVKMGVTTGPVIPGGYFHAGWRNSPATATGAPHSVLKTNGRGRYVGCILSDVSADRAFWMLESDESMVVDGKLSWLGTGLEDYFNAGWYYGNVFARPLHGLPIKAPFRTVQYRLHLTDAVTFNKSFEMSFERGPNNASHAAFESVSFYYLDHPQAADSDLANRVAPVDSVQPYTLMTDLWNFERFDDLEGQANYIQRYQEQFAPPFVETLAMRTLACRLDAGLISLDDFMAALSAFDSSTNEVVQTQQEALRRLYTEDGAQLIQFYANMPSELYLDGERILTAGDPQTSFFAVVNLKAGKHVLAAASAWQQYPPWTAVAVRDAKGFIFGTDGGWLHAVNPPGLWSSVDYDDSGWSGFLGFDARVKGPPEEPYVWVNPDPFVNTISKACGLRPSIPWPGKKGRVVYRNVFEVNPDLPKHVL